MQHFELYLHGAKVKVLSDNKAVVQNYSNPRSQPPARVERWVYRTTATFDLQFEYREGKSNIADYLSRHPIGDERDDDDQPVNESYVAFVAQHATPVAVGRKEIAAATARDARLQELKRFLSTNQATAAEREQSRSSSGFASCIPSRTMESCFEATKLSSHESSRIVSWKQRTKGIKA